MNAEKCICFLHHSYWGSHSNIKFILFPTIEICHLQKFHPEREELEMRWNYLQSAVVQNRSKWKSHLRFPQSFAICPRFFGVPQLFINVLHREVIILKKKFILELCSKRIGRKWVVQPKLNLLIIYSKSTGPILSFWSNKLFRRIAFYISIVTIVTNSHLSTSTRD